MRLIDADALETKMYHDSFETDSDMQKWESGCWIRYKLFENNLDNAPTIDAEPVKHGEWVAARIGETTSWYVECSECHVVMPPVNYSYCPNCGAKMDKGGDTE